MNQDQVTPDEIILDDEDIKKLADFFSVLIEIEQDLKRQGISLDES
jgi:hypothetical protein